MNDIKKYSAWGIVLDPERRRILVTKKLSNKDQTIKVLLALFLIQPEYVIKKFKWGFTKGKVKNWDDKQETALKEIFEEWGINSEDLMLIKHLWTFTKNKEYGTKDVDMSLYIINKSYAKPHPWDSTHIAARIDIDHAMTVIKNGEERTFLKSVIKDIEEVCNTYQKSKTKIQ